MNKDIIAITIAPSIIILDKFIEFNFLFSENKYPKSEYKVIVSREDMKRCNILSIIFLY